MNYFYNGKKPSAGLNIASGCLLIIAISAIIFLISAIDSLEDLEGHYLQLFFVCIMGGSIFYNFFRKKAQLHTHKIEILNNKLVINNIKTPINNITLEIYTVDKSFNRYHLWDKNGIISIFSVFEDDLINDFKNSYIANTNFHEEISSSQDGASVLVKSKENQLFYDLESGEYTITKEGEILVNKIPQFYIYDPKYKKGKALTKKK